MNALQFDAGTHGAFGKVILVKKQIPVLEHHSLMICSLLTFSMFLKLKISLKGSRFGSLH
jgi:hypothetical protein